MKNNKTRLFEKARGKKLHNKQTLRGKYDYTTVFWQSQVFFQKPFKFRGSRAKPPATPFLLQPKNGKKSAKEAPKPEASLTQLLKGFT